MTQGEVTEIDLTAFADWVNNAQDEGVPMLVATCHEGQPDIAFKGSLMVWDQDHLAFWERGLLETHAGLQSNPRVAIVYRHAERGQPLRFYGTVTIIESGELREQVWERVIPIEKGRDPTKSGVAVIVRIDRVRQGRFLLQQRQPASGR